MAPKKQNSEKNKALARMDFQISEMVFAKQKGYAPWPAIILAFHPNRPRCAKVGFLAWNQEWAYISFNSLLKMQEGKLLAANYPKNIQLQKAVKEMEFIISITQRLVNERLQANISESDEKSNTSIVETVGQKATNKDIEIRTKTRIVSNLEPVNRIRTRSQSSSESKSSLPDDIGGKSLQPISTEFEVAEVGRSKSPIHPKYKVQRPRTRSQRAKENEPNAKKICK